MKSLKTKLGIIAVFMMVVTFSANAQIGRGGTCLRTSTTVVQEDAGTCPLTLTEDQQLILDELRADYLAGMEELRTEMWSATTIAEKIAIRAEMVALREAHLDAVKALLEDWGY